MAEVCGVIHAATGRLVVLVGELLATGAWEGAGLRSRAAITTGCTTGAAWASRATPTSPAG